jgi:hypothetical protein
MKKKIEILLNLYLLAYEACKDMSFTDAADLLDKLELDYGICRAQTEHFEDYHLDWIDKYIPKGQAYICATPAGHFYNYDDPKKGLTPRIKVLQKELTRH